MALPRLRQAVVAAIDLDATATALEQHLGVHDPFVDSGVGHFGLRNNVYALGDTFIEIVSPTQDDTAAGRQIARAGGDCGYMCMFELADADATRRRVGEAGARLVHDSSHADIVDLHLHPKDVPGAIVALDITDPVGSWRWGGPEWTATAPTPRPGGVKGMTVSVPDPHKVVRRWSEVIGVDDAEGGVVSLGGGSQQIRFVAGDVEPGRIVGVDVAIPG